MREQQIHALHDPLERPLRAALVAGLHLRLRLLEDGVDRLQRQLVAVHLLDGRLGVHVTRFGFPVADREVLLHLPLLFLRLVLSHHRLDVAVDELAGGGLGGHRLIQHFLRGQDGVLRGGCLAQHLLQRVHRPGRLVRLKHVHIERAAQPVAGDLFVDLRFRRQQLLRLLGDVAEFVGVLQLGVVQGLERGEVRDRFRSRLGRLVLEDPLQFRAELPPLVGKMGAERRRLAGHLVVLQLGGEGGRRCREIGVGLALLGQLLDACQQLLADHLGRAQRRDGLHGRLAGSLHLLLERGHHPVDLLPVDRKHLQLAHQLADRLDLLDDIVAELLDRLAHVVERLVLLLDRLHDQVEQIGAELLGVGDLARLVGHPDDRQGVAIGAFQLAGVAPHRLRQRDQLVQLGRDPVGEISSLLVPVFRRGGVVDQLFRVDFRILLQRVVDHPGDLEGEAVGRFDIERPAGQLPGEIVELAQLLRRPDGEILTGGLQDLGQGREFLRELLGLLFQPFLVRLALLGEFCCVDELVAQGRNLVAEGLDELILHDGLVDAQAQAFGLGDQRIVGPVPRQGEGRQRGLVLRDPVPQQLERLQQFLGIGGRLLGGHRHLQRHGRRRAAGLAQLLELRFGRLEDGLGCRDRLAAVVVRGDLYPDPGLRLVKLLQHVGHRHGLLALQLDLEVGRHAQRLGAQAGDLLPQRAAGHPGQSQLGLDLAADLAGRVAHGNPRSDQARPFSRYRVWTRWCGGGSRHCCAADPATFRSYHPAPASSSVHGGRARAIG